MAVKIVIDAGHGGYDAGATYNGRREKDDTLALALAVGEILEAQGYDVVYTRTDDVYDSPVQKARIGNESGADFFVSIHRNSSPTPNQYNGVQTLIYNNAGLKATMAENVNKELEQVGYRNINVVERPDLAVLRRTRMPAILVEAGFINSDVDNNLFDTKFSETAEAIARGIDETIRDAGYTVAQGDMRSDVAQVSAPVSEEMYIAKSENDASGTQMVNEYYGISRTIPVFAEETSQQPAIRYWLASTGRLELHRIRQIGLSMQDTTQWYMRMKGCIRCVSEIMIRSKMQLLHSGNCAIVDMIR